MQPVVYFLNVFTLIFWLEAHNNILKILETSLNTFLLYYKWGWKRERENFMSILSIIKIGYCVSGNSFEEQIGGIFSA